MKNEELKIGDWVFWNLDKQPIRVDEFDADKFSPPINPEILEKNGFEKEGDYWNNHFGFPFVIRKGEREEYDLQILSWEEEDDITVFSIKNIHELQHALRLCGIDNKIEICQ